MGRYKRGCRKRAGSTNHNIRSAYELLSTFIMKKYNIPEDVMPSLVEFIRCYIYILKNRSYARNPECYR